MIISLYKDGHQLVDLSDPFLVSTMNGSEFTDVSEFDPIRGGNEMKKKEWNEYLLNDGRQYKHNRPSKWFSSLKPQKVTTCRVRTEKVENKRRDTDEPIIVKNKPPLYYDTYTTKTIQNNFVGRQIVHWSMMNNKCHYKYVIRWGFS